MKNVRVIWDQTLNVMALLVGITMLVIIGNRYIFHWFPSNDENNSELTVGKSFPLQGVRWDEHKQSLVIAMQVGCSWCEASSKFYKDLLRSNSVNAFHPVAVLPQTVQESRKFLDDWGIEISDLHQANLRALGVQGTPTIILVDQRGRIEASWLGQLSPTLEAEVFKKVGLTRVDDVSAPESGSASNPRLSLIAAAELADLLQKRPGTPLLDVDPRPFFQIRHVVGALNIPVQELEARAVHELPKASNIVVYCGFEPSCQSPSKSEPLQTFSLVDHQTETYCDLATKSLETLGFTHIRFISDDFAHLKLAGLDLITNDSASTDLQEAGNATSSASNGAIPTHTTFSQ